MYIYKEGKHLLGWHAGVQDKEETTFALFTKGWTDNKLGLEWVEQNIEKYTMEMFVPLYWPPAHANNYGAKGKPQILILDEHSFHLILQFFDYYLNRNI